MEYESYAIWWVPRPETALAQFGAEWTGWCADQGVPTDPEIACPAGERPRAPRWLVRRGLHASIRPPFRLAPGRSPWALEHALADLAERSETITLPPLRLAVLDARVVLAPGRADPGVSRLIAAVAEAVHPFALPRPATEPGDESAGTQDQPSQPSPDRLRLPLTGRLDPGAARAAVARLEARLAPVLALRHQIADLALVGDPGGGRPWRLLQRHALCAEATRREARMPDGMSWRGPSLLAPLAGSIAKARRSPAS